MLYAVNDGEKILASPGAVGICPDCDEPMVPKCGEIVSHHWAHRARADCDSWSEGETEWHRDWKALFRKEQTEVSLQRTYFRGEDVTVKHRADVVSRTGAVIEFQSSPITPEEVRERDSFYGCVLWVFNAIDSHQSDRLKIYNKGEYFSFRWARPRAAIAVVSQPHIGFYVDIGVPWDSEQGERLSGYGPLFHVKRIYTENTIFRGWGEFVPLEVFAREHKAYEGQDLRIIWERSLEKREPERSPRLRQTRLVRPTAQHNRERSVFLREG